MGINHKELWIQQAGRVYSWGSWLRVILRSPNRCQPHQGWSAYPLWVVSKAGKMKAGKSQTLVFQSMGWIVKVGHSATAWGIEVKMVPVAGPNLGWTPSSEMLKAPPTSQGLSNLVGSKQGVLAVIRARGDRVTVTPDDELLGENHPFIMSLLKPRFYL